jgi:hypothetical protein
MVADSGGGAGRGARWNPRFISSGKNGGGSSASTSPSTHFDCDKIEAGLHQDHNWKPPATLMRRGAGTRIRDSGAGVFVDSWEAQPSFEPVARALASSPGSNSRLLLLATAPVPAQIIEQPAQEATPRRGRGRLVRTRVGGCGSDLGRLCSEGRGSVIGGWNRDRIREREHGTVLLARTDFFIGAGPVEPANRAAVGRGGRRGELRAVCSGRRSGRAIASRSRSIGCGAGCRVFAVQFEGRRIHSAAGWGSVGCGSRRRVFALQIEGRRSHSAASRSVRCGSRPWLVERGDAAPRQSWHRGLQQFWLPLHVLGAWRTVVNAGIELLLPERLCLVGRFRTWASPPSRERPPARGMVTEILVFVDLVGRVLLVARDPLSADRRQRKEPGLLRLGPIRQADDQSQHGQNQSLAPPPADCSHPCLVPSRLTWFASVILGRRAIPSPQATCLVRSGQSQQSLQRNWGKG